MGYLLHALTLIFIILKVLGIGIVTSWSWWAILAPSLIWFVIVALVFAAMIVLTLFMDKKINKW